jgi:hypothetical protein
MAVFIPLLAVTQLAHWFGFLLDEIFFRGYRDVEVREPLFVVGVPRSGTTLLHRVLARDEERFTTFSTGELLFGASVTERRIWEVVASIDRRLFRGAGAGILGRALRAAGGLEGVHEIGPEAPEEDYLALVPAMSCFLLVLAFPFSERLWQLAFFDEQLPEDDRRWVLRFYRKCLQRHLYAKGRGRRLLSKNAAFGSWARSLREEFPDCRMILCVRDPVEAIPSQLSSLESGIRLFDADRGRTFFRGRMVEVLEHAYFHLAAVADDLPQNEAVVIRMEEMRGGLADCVQRIYGNFGFTMSPRFSAQLAEAGARARQFRSRHDYSLEQFGLSGKMIRTRFSKAYVRFAFSPPSSGETVTQNI